MKKTTLALALLNVVLLITACGTLTGSLLSPTNPVVTPATTNFVPVVVPASSNAVTGIVTPIQTNYNVVVTAPTTNYTYVPNTNLVAGIQTAQTVSNFLPAPWGTVTNGVLALALAGLGIYAKSKNGQASNLNDILTATVTGVEAASNALPPATASALKATIQTHAAAAGVQPDLDAVVQAVTKNMPTVPVNTNTSTTS